MRKPKKETIVYGWLGLLTLAVAALALPRKHLRLERLDIVEPDGRPRAIIANGARFPGLYVDGKLYRHVGREDRDRLGGFLFFNADGTEAGGMAFDSGVHEGKPYSNYTLMLDYNRQDQAVGFSTAEHGAERSAGMHVWDQPAESYLPLVELGDQAARARAEQREEIVARMRKLAREQGAFGERVFAGRTNTGDAVLKLSDAKGRGRLIMRVAADGKASIEFLNGAGKVVRRVR